MARAKWFLILSISILLFAFVLMRCILSHPPSLPPGVPESWKHHREMFGEFEVWLPEEWKALGSVRTLIHALREIAEGSEFPTLFIAAGHSEGDFHGWIKVKDYDAAFEWYAPLAGKELAEECSRTHPVTLTTGTDGISYLSATSTITIEQKGNGCTVAYQSMVLSQDDDKSLMRTFACVVSQDHVYQVYLDTVERSDDTDAPIHRVILGAFRVLK